MEIVKEDPKAGEVDNIKHLRGACTRMLRNQPGSYTLMLLNAFTLYMLEYKNQRYLTEAEELLSNAFKSIQEKESDWDEEKLAKILNTFKSKLLEKNEFLRSYLDNLTLYLLLNDLYANRVLKLLKNINQKFLHNYDN